jgi:hypothetical protein
VLVRRGSWANRRDGSTGGWQQGLGTGADVSVRRERTDDTQAVEFGAVRHLFGDDDTAAGGPCGGEEQCVVELKSAGLGSLQGHPQSRRIRPRVKSPSQRRTCEAAAARGMIRFRVTA